MKAAVLEENREDWLADAVATILCLANEMDTFSADDLAREMRPPAQQNWTGIAFSVARSRGYITTVGIHSSATKSRNGGIQRVWAAVKEEA
ncbi:hypothetical protein [Pseudarthrobacter sp. LT1]|uniref:hypothetical protein n=1 Tax=Pseudarthrobacter sp. LT1 TaxID=3111450 RepID=UPI002D7809BD|nr:hypothetical protein [Pseudarthrobacter sp. LT1]WRT14696.1 hypothetical protein VIK36_04155 [Pseudarthrobacter sp. LT1]